MRDTEEISLNRAVQRRSGSIVRTLFIIIATASIIVIFFFIYTSYLVDQYARTLYRSLNAVSASQGEIDSGFEGISMLIEVNVRYELSSDNPDLVNASGLEMLQAVFRAPEAQTSTDAQLLIQSRIEDIGLLGQVTLRIIEGVPNTISQIQRIAERGFIAPLPEPILQHPMVTEQTQRLRTRAIEADEQNDHETAIAYYRSYLARTEELRMYAVAQWWDTALRYGYILFRTGQYDEAQIVFRRIANDEYPALERFVARGMLDTIEHAPALLREYDTLSKRALAVEGNTQQQHYMRIGSILLTLMRYEEAIVAYRDAYEANPQSANAERARFNIGWCLKQLGRFDESRREFGAIDGLKAVSTYQVGETYRLEGDYEQAIDTYLVANGLSALSDEQSDFEGITLFQTAYTYLYNLNDPVRAKVYFDAVADTGTSSMKRYVEEVVEKEIERTVLQIYGTDDRARFFQELDEFVALTERRSRIE